jgi:hypothetical protein
MKSQKLNMRILALGLLKNGLCEDQQPEQFGV